MRLPRGAVLVLVLVHSLALLCGFASPNDPLAQERSLPFAPPTRVHLVDGAGRFRPWPFVHRWVERDEAPGSYVEDTREAYPLRFFVDGAPYRILGLLPARTHLLGVDAPGHLLLLGSDGFGRDQLSRLLHGAQITLFAGLLAALLSVSLGLLVGSLAGFAGGALDRLLMRGAELFLALPWLYLLLAVRAFLPLHVPPGRAFLLIVLVIGLVDWPRPARLVRGFVSSARERDYVLAARGFGASPFYLLSVHVMPQAFGLAATLAAVSIPRFVLAEVTLSFLGLGVSDPVPSWGNMLAALQQYHVLSNYWWMLLPGLALVPVLLAYQSLAEALGGRSARGADRA